MRDLRGGQRPGAILDRRALVEGIALGEAKRSRKLQDGLDEVLGYSARIELQSRMVALGLAELNGRGGGWAAHDLRFGGPVGLGAVVSLEVPFGDRSGGSAEIA